MRTTKGKLVPAQTFQRMLINPLYAGWVCGRVVEVNVRGDWMPIIDQKSFDTVQDVLAGRKPNLTSYERNNPDFPLRRFVRCGKCGTSLTGSWSSGRNGKYAYYHCPKKACLAVNVKQEKLQSSFLNWLERLTPQQEAIERNQRHHPNCLEAPRRRCSGSPACVDRQVGENRDQENDSGKSMARWRNRPRRLYGTDRTAFIRDRRSKSAIEVDRVRAHRTGRSSGLRRKDRHAPVTSMG